MAAAVLQGPPATEELTIPPPPECENDKSFVFKKDGNIDLGCSYVAKKPKNRCEKTIDGEKVRDKCPLVCKKHACKCKNSRRRLMNGSKTKCKDISLRDAFCEPNGIGATYCPFNCNTCSRIKCDKPGVYGRKRSLKKYNKHPDMVFARAGFYRLVEPETATKQFLGSFEGLNDGHCPDTTDRLCVQKCLNEVKKLRFRYCF